MNFKINLTMLLNLTFSLFFLSQLFFAYTLFSRLMLILFVASTIPLWTKRMKNNYFTAYVLFVAWAAILTYTTEVLDSTVAKDMLKTLIWNSGFLFAFSHYITAIGSPLKFFDLYKKIAVIASIVAIITSAGDVIAGGRLGGVLNANVAGMLAAYGLIIQVYELLNDASKRRKVLPYLLLILFVVVVLFSASRKAFIIPFIGLYILVCSNKPRKFVIYSFITFTIVGVVLWLMINVPSFYEVVGYRIESVLKFLNEEEFEDGSLVSRVDFVKLAWSYIERNYLTGYGLNCFYTLPGAHGTYSHNNYVEIIFSTGIIGCIIYYIPSLSALLSSIVSMSRNHESKNELALVISLFIPFLVCDYFNITFFERLWIIIPAAAIMFIERARR